MSNAQEIGSDEDLMYLIRDTSGDAAEWAAWVRASMAWDAVINEAFPGTDPNLPLGG